MKNPHKKINNRILTKAIRMLAADLMEGVCLECEAERAMVEPDGRDYDCPECGEEAVYGAAEIILMKIA